MKITSLLSAAIIGAASLIAVGKSSAATIFADTVIAFSNSGAGPIDTGAYGGVFPGSFPADFPVSVPLSYATDGDATTFVSLPTASFITLGFSTGFVFDGPGLDIFISEVGGSDELASIFVSSDLGTTFTFLGTATTSTVSGFDLASIGYTANVNAVKIVGLDNGGSSPGFDLAYVQGLEGSSVSTVPESISTFWTLSALFTGFAAIRSIRKKRTA